MRHNISNGIFHAQKCLKAPKNGFPAVTRQLLYLKRMFPKTSVSPTCSRLRNVAGVVKIARNDYPPAFLLPAGPAPGFTSQRAVRRLPAPRLGGRNFFAGKAKAGRGSPVSLPFNHDGAVCLGRGSHFACVGLATHRELSFIASPRIAADERGRGQSAFSVAPRQPILLPVKQKPGIQIPASRPRGRQESLQRAAGFRSHGPAWDFLYRHDDTRRRMVRGGRGAP